ncbi:hypothetical protein [Marinomonas mediterranea]|uniref:hypothetical protein n=1 Tax=Marinomonas mediterranea TaxID=119864 RepID=UPI00234A5DCE|nr:hypothetical protein [Marinomonas mediterranea]WCN08713.1 hypothetical protein GV055_07090 [Marinomonas mediterranea]
MSIEIIIALYQEDYLTDKEVIDWADDKILKEEEPFDYLYMLSLKGPRHCLSLPSTDFPIAKQLTYSERFALRATKLNLESEEDCDHFREWVASASLGEDLSLPEVMFGYHIDEDFYCTDNHSGGLKYFKEEMLNLIDKTKNLAEALWSKIA